MMTALFVVMSAGSDGRPHSDSRVTWHDGFAFPCPVPGAGTGAFCDTDDRGRSSRGNDCFEIPSSMLSCA